MQVRVLGQYVKSDVELIAVLKQTSGGAVTVTRQKIATVEATLKEIPLVQQGMYEIFQAQQPVQLYTTNLNDCIFVVAHNSKGTFVAHIDYHNNLDAFADFIRDGGDLTISLLAGAKGLIANQYNPTLNLQKLWTALKAANVNVAIESVLMRDARENTLLRDFAVSVIPGSAPEVTLLLEQNGLSYSFFKKETQVALRNSKAVWFENVPAEEVVNLEGVRESAPLLKVSAPYVVSQEVEKALLTLHEPVKLYLTYMNIFERKQQQAFEAQHGDALRLVQKHFAAGGLVHEPYLHAVLALHDAAKRTSLTLFQQPIKRLVLATTQVKNDAVFDSENTARMAM